MKKVSIPKTAHTSNSKKGMGDSYGSGIKQKLGKVHDDMIMGKPISKKKMGKPPKSLA